MRQPDGIHAHLRNADSKIAQTAAEVFGLDAQIAAIVREAPDLERAMIAGQAALARVDRRAAERAASAFDAEKGAAQPRNCSDPCPAGRHPKVDSRTGSYCGGHGHSLVPKPKDVLELRCRHH